MKTARIKFDNITADNVVEFDVSFEGVDLIMDWYGAFYAGDEYTVSVDGREMVQDINGGRDHGLVDMKPIGVH